MITEMAVFLTLFLAGILTIFLPCILPLIPIVLGVSISGRNRLRPLITILGMVVSFVFFTFLIQVLLSQFFELADILRISTYYILLLFGICFLTGSRIVQLLVAVLGGFFYWNYGWISIVVALISGVVAIELGGRVAGRLQQLGTDVQQSARSHLGAESLLTAFIIGLTLGLVWVPCAGPALTFALTLVRDQPGVQALLALTAYALGTAVPLLIVGYGGQWAVHSVHALSQYSGRVKQVAGAILILTALGFQYGWLMDVQTWIVQNTRFGTLGAEVEESLFPALTPPPLSRERERGATTPSNMVLPKLARAPEFTGLGPWHNSPPLTLKELKGRVVLVDFWTYSCINCIRTLPYMRGYWNKFKDQPFVLLGVHTPEFVFEKDPKNVAAAIKKHGLTYPIAQDNDYGTWNAFANRYWPAKYLIDADGYIRYTHFGEGNYEETDLAIQSLLAEIGATATGPMIGERGSSIREGDEGKEGEEDTEYRERSPETYLGSRSWPAFFNSAGDPDDRVHSYAAPSSLPLHHYVLVGEWQLIDGEHQILRSTEGEIRFRALASEVNLVLGLEEGVKSVQADVFVGGKKTKSITIDKNDLYNLFTGEYGEHEIVLKIHGKGVAGYAFTFGG